VFAEQSEGTNESGATSRINTAYEWLVAKGANYGETDAGDWGNNWGSMWNRIMESATWEPDGTATAADVADGKTFYAGNGDRTQKTGSASLAPDYSAESLQDWDDMKNYDWGSFTPNGTGEDNTDEEASWTNTAGDATTGVWKDGRTGLYWSANQGKHNDLFTKASCAFFSTTPRGAYAGDDTDCGPIVVNEGVTVSAINVCGQLELDADGDSTAETDWYLPSQKELMHAYIDGIFNQTNPTFTTYESFWSSTERSDDSDHAWLVRLPYGSTYDVVKSLEGNLAVRCVRRD
jgi:hypothetical protein